MDIQRHLSNEPVMARPPSRSIGCKTGSTKQSCFCRAAAVAAALIAGLGASPGSFSKKEKPASAPSRRTSTDPPAQEAELARSNEAELRRQPKPARRSPRPKVLVSQADAEEADAMIGQASPTESSVEDAALLRSLGDWHALEGRWTLRRSLRLASASQPIGRWDVSTLDFLRSRRLPGRERGGGHDIVSSGGSVSVSPPLQRRGGGTNRPKSASYLLHAKRGGVLAPLAAVAGESFAAADTHTRTPLRALGHRFSGLWEYRRATSQEHRVGQKLPGLSRIQCA